MWRYLFVGVVFAGWLVFGDPINDFANLFWPATPAPWESVDGVYYPDRYDLSKFEENVGLADLDACRDWVDRRSRQMGDEELFRGDYECGFGFIKDWRGVKVYRLTVR